MKLELKLIDEQDMYLEDAYLAFGWLVLDSRGMRISLFEDKGCMVFLTSTNFLANCYDLFKDKKSSFAWIADGYGAAIQVSRVKKIVEISNGAFVLNVHEGVFVKAVITGFGEIIQNIERSRADILDLRFEDLKKYYKLFFDITSK